MEAFSVLNKLIMHLNSVLNGVLMDRKTFHLKNKTYFDNWKMENLSINPTGFFNFYQSQKHLSP